MVVDDAFVGTHMVLDRIHRGPGTFAAGLRVRQIGNDGRPEKLVEQVDKKKIRRRGIGIRILRCPECQILGLRGDAVAMHSDFVAATTKENLRLSLGLDGPPCGYSTGQMYIDHTHDGTAKHTTHLGVLEVHRFLLGEGHIQTSSDIEYRCRSIGTVQRGKDPIDVGRY